MERFEGRIPSANEPIRAFLIRDMGFSKQGAEDCISALRTSIKQLGDVPSEIREAANQDGETFIGEIGNNPAEQRREHPLASREVIRLPLTKDCYVELRFEGPVTTNAVDNLIKHIDLMRSVWADEQ